jgi:nitroimidazol reductase NimA-like FMN-containing flavoprotein (pyridoxamine 5'-phosphate oxidase superfamily)
MQFERTTTYGAWTGAEIESFLGEARIPLRVAIQGAKGPLIVALWYQYEKGSLWSCSPSHSFVVQALEVHSEVGFDVSTNDLPYKGVRGRCHAYCNDTESKRELEHLLRRYLGGTDNGLARWLLARPVTETVIRFDIDWLTSWDFTPRMGDLEKLSSRDPDLDL